MGLAQFARLTAALGVTWFGCVSSDPTDSDAVGQTPSASEPVVPSLDFAPEHHDIGPDLGIRIPILDPSGTALDALHRGLDRAARGEGLARLVFYGASHTAADHYVGYLRDALQRRLGDAGRGFVVAAWPSVSYRYWQWGVRVSRGKGWERLKLGYDYQDPDYYGLAGVGFDSAGGEAFARVDTEHWGVGQHLDEFDVHYLQQPGGGAMPVYVDGARVGVIETDGPIAAGTASFEVEDGPHRVSVHVGDGAPVRLYGFSLFHGTTGVVVDNLALSGSRARYHLKWLDPIYSTQLAEREPDFIGLLYGGNEGNDGYLPVERFEENLRDAIARIRQILPEASCLLIGPPDRLEEVDPDGNEYRPSERTASLAEIAERTALDYECGFFDTIRFMGGRGSMARWVSADPPLARDDRVHLKAIGYRRLGEVLYEALLDGWSPPDAR